MATAPAIPATEYKNVLKWFDEGESTRDIAEKLKERGVEVHHSSVWRLIQKTGAATGGDDAARAAKALRGSAAEAVAALHEIERSLLDCTNPDEDPQEAEFVLRNLRAFTTLHRLLCNRLRLIGVTGKQGDRLIRDFAHLWAGEEVQEVVETPESVATPTASEVLHVEPPKPLETSEVRRNNPPPVAAKSAPAPSRNGTCPCGSRKKYKQCCEKTDRLRKAA